MSDTPKPLEALLAVDRAMRAVCERLLTADPAATIQLRREIESMMRAHHEDEETLLFPALMEAVAGSDPVCLRELTDLLTSQHRMLERAWESVVSARPGEVDVEIGTFIQGYLQHAEREEQELFPMAARLLADAEIANLEQNLHARSSG